MLTEISLQAAHIFPRIGTVLVLISLSCLVAKITQIFVQYVLSSPGDNQTTKSRFRNLPKYSFWTVILVLTPNILSAFGLDFLWIAKIKDIVGRVFTIWPVWLAFGLLFTPLCYTAFKFPKSYAQSKKPLENSPHNELQG